MHYQSIEWGGSGGHERNRKEKGGTVRTNLDTREGKRNARHRGVVKAREGWGEEWI